MGTFEFLFSLFGLLLGFSIAEIAGGFSRAYDRRKVQRIGWLAPLLAALLIVDVLTFWYGAWFLRDIQLKFWVVLLAGMIGLLYYFAATQVFPRQGSTQSPSDHMMAHRRPVVLAVMAANLIMFAPSNIAQVITTHGARLVTPLFWVNPAYFVLMTAVGFLPDRRWVTASMIALLVLLISVAVLTNY